MSSYKKLIKTNFDAEKKIWSGEQVPRYYDGNASVGQVVFYHMGLNIDKVIQVNDCDGVKLTNREALVLGVRVAQRFQKLGVTQDDVIGIVGSNSTNLLPIVLGSIFSAVAFNAMNENFDNDEFQDMLLFNRPKMIFCDGAVYPHILSTLNELKISVDIFTIQDHIPGVARVDEFFEPTKTETSFLPTSLKNGGDQTAAIVCSLEPNGNETNGVCISNKCLTDFQEGLCTENVICSFSTLYHLQSIYAIIWSLIANATRIITTKPFSAHYMLELIDKYLITDIALTPSEAVHFVQGLRSETQILTSLKRIVLTGHLIPESILSELRNRLKTTEVIIGYGTIELQKVCAVNILGKAGSVGSLMPNVQAKILNNVGKQLDINESGHIAINSGFNWKGYSGNSDKTKTMYGDGWLYTGDFGYFDEDGDLFIEN